MSAILLIVTAGIVYAGDIYKIDRYSIDGGGVMRSTGGDFELSGTIGQPDAGTMTGDDFELTGGFWFALSPADCNEDGGVNLFDYTDWKQCLSGPDAIILPGCECFDLNRNGSIDLHDFAVTQITFSG